MSEANASEDPAASPEASQPDGPAQAKIGLIGTIATGGMAEILVGAKLGAGGFVQAVAVKRILPHLVSDEKYTAMFFREARLGAVIDHPSCLKVHDAVYLEGRLALVMELFDGVTAGQLVIKLAEQAKLLPVDLACYIAWQAASALDYVHSLKNLDGLPLNIVHHDISPTNIALTYAGHVKILDFGVAHADHVGELPPELTEPGAVRGKFSYMAPEVLHGSMNDPRSDIFSLGCVLFEMLAGQPAFAGNNGIELVRQVLQGGPPQLAPFRGDMPEGLEAVVQKAMARDPAERYQTAGALRDDLEPYLASAGEDRRLAFLLEDTYPPATDPDRVRLRELLADGMRKTPPPALSGTPAVPQRSPVAPAKGGKALVFALGGAAALAVAAGAFFTWRHFAKSKPPPPVPVAVTHPAVPVPAPVPTPIPIPEPPRPTPKPAGKGGHAGKAGKEPKEGKEAKETKEAKEVKEAKAGKEPKPLPPPKALEASTLAPSLEATAATVRITARSPEPELNVVLYVEGGGVPEVRLPIKVGAHDTFTHKIFGNPGEDFRYRWEISDGKASKDLGPFKIHFKDGSERP